MSDGTMIIGAANAPAADDYALLLAEERLIIEAQVTIQRLLDRAGKNQGELAQLLGMSEARVSRMFSANSRDLTLRNLARAFHVLGSRCRFVDVAEVA